MKLKKIISKTVSDISNKIASPGLEQNLNSADGFKYETEGINEKILEAGEESIVLLKNDGILPFKATDKIAVFGRCQLNWFYVGYGSGGDVHPTHKINLIDALEKTELRIDKRLAEYYRTWCNNPDNVPIDGVWGMWPTHYDELKLTNEMVTLASISNNCAVVIIGRAAGEDRECRLQEGSYYLTQTEKHNLDLICDSFNRVVVVMNCGNIVDMSWVKAYNNKISAVIYAWQCGQESGTALSNILSGKTNPSGKMCDTIAVNYESYPSSHFFGNREYNNYSEDIFVGYRYFETFAKDKVLYHFGFGLSYTSFSIEPTKFTHKGRETKLTVTVKNTGKTAGKETVQIYVNAPQGKLGKASRVLVQFEKTKLLKPEESQNLSFTIDDYAFASYDDTGVTGFKSSYVLEEGEYTFYAGNSVRTDIVAGSFTYDEIEIISTHTPVCAVKNPFPRLTAETINDKNVPIAKMLPESYNDLAYRILSNLPENSDRKIFTNITYKDVKSGKATIKEFLAQMSLEELEGLTRGHGAMNSCYGFVGNAGAIGGITTALREIYGLPAVIMSDGPAGIRLQAYTALIPCGSALACTFNKKLLTELMSLIAKELRHYQVDVLLSPGMNIHRNPLCGRNFEYFSEDPVLSGECASAEIAGIQSLGSSACPKHFACNNQEVNRNHNDSRVSERALREIYLKGFEIAVKKSKPMCIMTSYNKINSVWSHYNYDLATTVLRNEWGYEGMVMTDWWMRKSVSPEFPLVKDNAYRVRAQVDVLMPGNTVRVGNEYVSDGTLCEYAEKAGGITRGEILRSAENVMNLILKLDK